MKKHSPKFPALGTVQLVTLMWPLKIFNPVLLSFLIETNVGSERNRRKCLFIVWDWRINHRKRSNAHSVQKCEFQFINGCIYMAKWQLIGSNRTVEMKINNKRSEMCVNTYVMEVPRYTSKLSSTAQRTYIDVAAKKKKTKNWEKSTMFECQY